MNKHHRKFLNKVVDRLERPYCRNLHVYGLSEHELKWVLRKINKKFIHINFDWDSKEFKIKDEYGDLVYVEVGYSGTWEEKVNGDWIFSEVKPTSDFISEL